MLARDIRVNILLTKIIIYFFQGFQWSNPRVKIKNLFGKDPVANFLRAKKQFHNRRQALDGLCSFHHHYHLINRVRCSIISVCLLLASNSRHSKLLRTEKFLPITVVVSTNCFYSTDKRISALDIKVQKPTDSIKREVKEITTKFVDLRYV